RKSRAYARRHSTRRTKSWVNSPVSSRGSSKAKHAPSRPREFLSAHPPKRPPFGRRPMLGVDRPSRCHCRPRGGWWRGPHHACDTGPTGRSGPAGVRANSDAAFGLVDGIARRIDHPPAPARREDRPMKRPSVEWWWVRVVVLLATLIAVPAVWPLRPDADPCKSAGKSCRTNQSCCSGVCVKGTSASGTCCLPTTCAIQGASCGTISDGCAETLDCGTCTAPATCGGGGTAHVCGT